MPQMNEEFKRFESLINYFKKESWRMTCSVCERLQWKQQCHSMSFSLANKREKIWQLDTERWQIQAQYEAHF